MDGVPEKRYQVFVSSTYEDLREQRDAVMRSLLEINAIPVAMEMFSAADASQWEVIQRTIRLTDYYVVIVAHRYGSTLRGVSYTEKEYDFAKSIGVPTLGFLLKDGIPWDPKFIDKGQAAKRLARFRGKVKKKLSSFWSTTDELALRVTNAVVKEIQRSPRPGWVRSDNAVSPQVANEIGRLSAENARLSALAQTTPAVEGWKEVLEDLDDCAEDLNFLTNHPGSIVHLNSSLRKADKRIKRLELDLGGLDTDLLEEARAVLKTVGERSASSAEAANDLRVHVLNRLYTRATGQPAD